MTRVVFTSLNYLCQFFSICYYVANVQWRLLLLSLLIITICVDDVTNVRTQFNQSKLRNFISSWKVVKNNIKLCRRLFLFKYAKKISRQMFFAFASMASLTPNSNFCNFMTSKRTDQNATKFCITIFLY